MNRRQFVKLPLASLGVSPLTVSSLSILRPDQALAFAPEQPRVQGSNIKLRISPVTLDLGPGKSIKTVGYNGSVPGPVLRFAQGKPVTIDIYNDTEVAEVVHWHGQRIAPAVDGSEEEGTPMVMPHSQRQYRFNPGPVGTRWYHTHTMARIGASSNADLTRAGFSGQYGFAIIDPSSHPGDYDQEVFIAIHHWEPALAPLGPADNGWEIAYKSATFNGKMLGAGEPIRVKEGQRVLFRLLNASATDEVRIALPGHKFHVVAMDGNSVPSPRDVDFLYLDIGERIDAIVEMKNPGVWVFGSLKKDERDMGMGVVVEYANKSGQPQWIQPPDPGRGPWDYSQFCSTTPAPEPDQTFEMHIEKVPGHKKDFNHWTINGKSFPDIERLRVEKGKRYRLAFNNDSGDVHPLHLHRHTFEITQVGDKQMSGLRKDVISVARRSKAAVDFVADNPGLTLFHCHMQLHMDFGFMQLVEYA